MVYSPIAISEGKLEIQNLPYAFSRCSAIVERSVQSDKYWNPQTGKISTLIGQTEFENLTASSILSRPQFIILNNIFLSPQGKNGSLTGTHILGNVTTILTGVRILSLTYGEFEKTSNSAAEITIEISFEGRRIT